MADTLCRPVVPYQLTGTRFLRLYQEQKSYKQFNHLYISSLSIMRPLLLAEAKKRWPDPSLRFTEKIIDSESAQGEDCILIGTLYKEMELKPSVLDEFKDFANISTVVKPIHNYQSDSDFLLLEDDSGRVRLRGLESAVSKLVTGISLTLRGRIDDTGIFQVLLKILLIFSYFM